MTSGWVKLLQELKGNGNIMVFEISEILKCDFRSIEGMSMWFTLYAYTERIVQNKYIFLIVYIRRNFITEVSWEIIIMSVEWNL